MPHREKLAWMTLLWIAVTYGPYFVHVAMSPPAAGEMPNLPQLWLLALAAGGNGILHILGRIGLRIASRMTPARRPTSGISTSSAARSPGPTM